MRSVTLAVVALVLSVVTLRFFFFPATTGPRQIGRKRMSPRSKRFKPARTTRFAPLSRQPHR